MRGIVLFIIKLLIIAAFVTYAIISTKKAKQKQTTTWLMRFWEKPSVKSIAASLIAIFIGLFIGCIILLLFVGRDVNGVVVPFKTCIEAIELLFDGVFCTGRTDGGALIFGWNGTNIGDVLFNAMPLILTGLSVAVAFKVGLFNIGAPGQYLMGTAASLIIALSIPSTPGTAWLIWILAFLGGVLAGALWGAIPGIFKAYLNVNEVITCIMTNWIAANVVTALFDNNTGPFRHLLDPSSTKNWGYVYKSSHNGISTFKMGLDKIFPGSQVNAGIIVAIVIAIIIFIIMNKTTMGYELKACGSNRNAAKYAGINEKKNIILSMAIAGGLAAASAALYYLSGNTEFKWETYQTLPAVGFNGIAVALLAVNNPVGVIFSAIFMAYLNVSGMTIKNLTCYNEYITSIVAAIIVYFSAFALFLKQLLSGQYFKKKRKPKEKKDAPVEPVLVTDTQNGDTPLNPNQELNEILNEQEKVREQEEVKQEEKEENK